MQKWEYKVRMIYKVNILEELEKLGEEGWELAATDKGMWVFKRPKQEQEYEMGI